MNSIRQLEKDLWESADRLRSNSSLTSNEYCMPVLGLIFLRYAYSRFKKAKEEILKDPRRPSRGGRVLPVEQSDFTKKSALYLPKEAQYEYLVNLPRDVASAGLVNQDGYQINSLGEAVNNAMRLIEDQSEILLGVLPKNYDIFSDGLLGELLRIFNNKTIDEVGGDVIGRIYEYFLNKFARNIAADDGVFFTPKSLVKMIVNVLEPKSGVLLDCACGSGGMFVQSGDFVNASGMNANSAMTFYGQEKADYNAALCLMNMAVHGLTGVIKSGDDANTFYNDAHNLDGQCDYVMANPPFNVKNVNAESCESAGRLPFGLPSVNDSKEVGNANYLWISYFYSYLNAHGRAGFVMASSATDSQGKDKEIREKLVRTGHVDVMISVGNNFFYTKSLPCSLWFFDKAKSETNKDKVLFIDARNYYTVVDRTLNEWNEWQLKNLSAIVWLYRGEREKYKKLLNEYRDYLCAEADAFDVDGLKEDVGKDTFAEIASALKERLSALRKTAKTEVEAAGKRDKKNVQQMYDEKIAYVDKMLTAAKEANWLYEKFGDGDYTDILGLCKLANLEEIEEKSWSLTPGAYVGVKPIEDDGTDFAERMAEIHRELISLQNDSNELMDSISQSMKEMGL